MNISKQLAVFPLPIFLLPNGRTKLRIFEPKYIRMVKESAGKDGFVISLSQEAEPFNTANWGAWVSVIDFEPLPGGLLGITVEAKSLVNLTDLFLEQDDLLKATISERAHWSQQQTNVTNKDIVQAYEDLLEQQPLLQGLYPNIPQANIQWTVSRWLEILPLSFDSRKKLSHFNSFELALDTVKTILIGK